jgi:chromosome partitioning protein
MFITIASYKGGVGKTTTAVHVAAFLQEHGPTVLVDGDPTRSATQWAQRGGFPFTVTDERGNSVNKESALKQYQHIVVDTEARPGTKDLLTLIPRCDLLIVPSTADALALDGLMLTTSALQALGAENWRVLLTSIPPAPSSDGVAAMAILRQNQIPVFRHTIPRLVAFQKAALAGQLVYQVSNPRAAIAWSAYQNLGKELLSNGKPVRRHRKP